MHEPEEKKVNPNEGKLSVDLVLHQIQTSISNGTFLPGTKIPSERELATMFNTTRGYVRKAIQQLELHGIMEVIPQKGSYVSNLGKQSLNVLMSNLYTSKKYRAENLIETRAHLEFLSATLAARRGDKDNFLALKKAHERYTRAFSSGESTLEEDHLFHLAIVKASKNEVLKLLISLITPDIIVMNKNYKETSGIEYCKNTDEHETILNAILARDEEKAGKAMKRHMDNSRKRRLNDD